MKSLRLLMACLLLPLLCAALAKADPPHSDKPKHDDSREGGHKPQAMFLTNVNVDVQTDVDISSHPAPSLGKAAREDDDDDEEEDDDEEADFEDLIEAAQNFPEGGPAIRVLTNINIKVSTRVQVHRPLPPPGKGHPPAPAGTHPKERQKKGAEKQLREKRSPGSDVGSNPEVTNDIPIEDKTEAKAQVTPRDQHLSLALSRLTLADPVELGFTGTLADEVAARELAMAVNGRARQVWLGVSSLPLILPVEPDSVRTLQRAVSSVKAQVHGNQVEISAKIPRATFSALYGLVRSASQSPSP